MYRISHIPTCISSSVECTQGWFPLKLQAGMVHTVYFVVDLTQEPPKARHPNPQHCPSSKWEAKKQPGDV